MLQQGSFGQLGKVAEKMLLQQHFFSSKILLQQVSLGQIFFKPRGIVI